MMIECPRCAFVQPKDRYCANCGIDVENYQPKPKPLVQRLIHNTGFQVGLAFTILLISFSVIYQSQKEAIRRHVQKLEDTQGAPGETPQPALESDEQTFALSKAAPPPLSTPPSAALLTAPLESAEAVPVPEADAPSAAKVAPAAMELRFLELSSEGATEILEQGSPIFESSDYRIVSIPKAKSPVKFHELPGKKTASLDLKSKLQVQTFVGPGEDEDPELRPPAPGAENEEMGFTLTITPREIGPERIEWIADGSLTFKTREGVATKALNVTFGSPAQDTVVILGWVPRQEPLPSQAKKFSESPLDVLNSQEFQSGQHEFAIFIDAR